MAKGKISENSKNEVEDSEYTIDTSIKEDEVTTTEKDQEEQPDKKEKTEKVELTNEKTTEKIEKTENELKPDNEVSKRDSEEVQPPPQPPRPLSEFQKSQLTLSEAFPSIETNVIRAVLIAASGQVDPAFNGLLSLTDPEYKLDEESVYKQVSQLAPPPPLPKGVLRNSQNPTRYRTPTSGLNSNQQQRATAYASAAATIRNDRSQIEEDERLARLLAEQDRVGNGGQRRVRYADTGLGPEYTGPDDYPRRGSATRRQYQYDDDERSFFDDDLPQIKENIAKGLQETKDNINNWLGNLRKKMDLEEPNFLGGLLNNKNNNNRRYSDDDDQLYEDYGRRQANEQYNRGYQSGPARARAREEQRNQNDGFDGIKMTYHDEEDDVKPVMPPRPGSGSVNSNTSSTVLPATDKKIPLKSTGTTEEEDPFFIGDSDDEEDEVPLGEQIISKPKVTTATTTTTVAVDEKEKSDEADK
ncbi:hypothetical protein D0Z03_001267 [Geotrichum reessii]|nr:hypothetical protein D0Z03_001267 [Galactomyces reessii]